MKARNLALVSLLTAVGALAVMLLLAGRDDRVRNDALLFLDRFDPIDIDDPLEERRAQIDRIAAMPIASDEVEQVRALCDTAHRTMIEAEERSAAARNRFAEATAGGRGEGDLGADVRARIEADLAESDAALERARELLPRCSRDLRSLSMRFRPQRSGQRETSY